MGDDRSSEAARLESALARGAAAEVVARAGAASVELLSSDERLLLAEARHLTGDGEAAIADAELLLAEAEASQDDELGALATAVRALALVRRGDAAGQIVARESIAAATRRVGRPLGRVSARLYHADGVLRLREGDFEGARVSLLWALASARQDASEWRAAAILDTLGVLHARCGDTARAMLRFDESLAAKRNCGDILGQAITHGNRGRYLLGAGRPDEALCEFDADLALAREAGDGYGEVVASNGRGMALLAAGRVVDAETELMATRDLATERGLAKPAALCTKDLALVAERAGRVDEALARIDEAASAFARQGNSVATGYIRTVHARILYRANRLPEARSKLLWAVKALRGCAQPELFADALVRLAEVSAESHPAEAHGALDEAEALALKHYLRDVVREVHRLRDVLRIAAREAVSALPELLSIGRDRREYLLVSQLSSGAQGEAWKALDTHTGQLVVVKRMRLPTDANKREMCLRQMHAELESAMRVDHPGVVRVFGFDRRGNDFFLSMELLPGPELQSRIDDIDGVGEVDAETAWRWIEELAEGLDALRAARIVHRDLKPANVVFGPGGRPVLIDFGIAIPRAAPTEGAEDRPAAEQREIAGTYGYMAPEQILGGDVDHRTDLFAFGVIATELLTGQNFVRRATNKKQYAEYFRMMAVRSRFTQAVNAIPWPEHVTPRERAAVLRLLEREPDDRPATALEFLEAAGRQPAAAPS